MTIRRSNIALTGKPIILWDNVVTSTNVAAESDSDFPISNVANPSTALKWKHDVADSPVSAVEYITIDTTQARINYVAIHGHNFGTAGIAVGLELASSGSPIGGGESIFEPQIPADDTPIVFLFIGTNVSADSPIPISEVEEIRIIFIPTITQAEAAVIYAGEYTELTEGIQAEHTPLPLARVSEVISGKSENGAFLGRITLNEGLTSSATISNMDPEFVRVQIIPFLEDASENPFFWIWSPANFPDEIAYAWLENDPQPSFDIDNYVSITLDMRGLGS